MIVSTRGRYALRVMLDLAEHGGEHLVPLKEIAARQEISLKYLESIMTVLSKAGFVDAMHGKGGGYKLSRPAETYTLADVLRLTETTLAPVSCLEDGEKGCPRAAGCLTLPIWMELDRRIQTYLESVTVASLLKQ